MSATRLAVVIPDLAVGGLQNMALGLAFALDRAAWDPRVYTFDAEGPFLARLQRRDVPHVHLPRPPGVAPGFAKVLAERFRADGIELVHCHNVTACWHGARAAWRAGGLPVLFTEHDREMPAPFKHRVLHRWLARRVHATVAVSQRLADDLVRYEGFPAGRTQRLVNGIPDPEQGFAGDRAAARAELGWDARPVVLAVGSLTPVKNHAGLLRAFELLHAERGAAAPRLVVAGDGPLRDELAAAAAERLPDGAVQWLGNRDDIPRLLRAADVFVLPSHREGLPLCLVEAHAMGCPSVSYDVGGNGEVTEDGVTGVLVPYPDERAFAGAVGALLDDGDRAAALARAGRARFEARFTHAQMVAEYIEHYERLLVAVGR